MLELEEADQVSPAGDHWGDYTKDHGDPYPATAEAWDRVTNPVPGDVVENPEEARRALDAFATQPMRYAQPVRIAPADTWGATSWNLADGAQGVKVLENDPNRRSVTIYNHSTGGFYIAPTPTRSVGPGAHYIPGVVSGIVSSRRLETSGEMWLFTLAGYVAGAEPVQFSAITEHFS